MRFFLAIVRLFFGAAKARKFAPTKPYLIDNARLALALQQEKVVLGGHSKNQGDPK